MNPSWTKTETWTYQLIEIEWRIYATANYSIIITRWHFVALVPPRLVFHDLASSCFVCFCFQFSTYHNYSIDMNINFRLCTHDIRQEHCTNQFSISFANSHEHVWEWFIWGIVVVAAVVVVFIDTGRSVLTHESNTTKQDKIRQGKTSRCVSQIRQEGYPLVSKNIAGHHWLR